jgi:hypothetical protein
MCSLLATQCSLKMSISFYLIHDVLLCSHLTIVAKTRSSKPEPGELLEEADKLEPRRRLEDYWPVIQRLREKRLTFREIADWMKQHGLAVDHNMIYRAYAKRARELTQPGAGPAEEEPGRETWL